VERIPNFNFKKLKTHNSTCFFSCQKHRLNSKTKSPREKILNSVPTWDQGTIHGPGKRASLGIINHDGRSAGGGCNFRLQGEGAGSCEGRGEEVEGELSGFL
jgi:hypothetical protein